MFQGYDLLDLEIKSHKRKKSDQSENGEIDGKNYILIIVARDMQKKTTTFLKWT